MESQDLLLVRVNSSTLLGTADTQDAPLKRKQIAKLYDKKFEMKNQKIIVKF